MLRITFLISMFVITGCTSINKVDNASLFEQAMLINPKSSDNQSGRQSVNLKFSHKEIRFNHKHRVSIFELFKNIENDSTPRLFLTGGGDLGQFLKRVKNLTDLTPRIAKLDYHYSPDADEQSLKIELFHNRAGDYYE